LLLRTVFLTSFGGELGLNGFSTSGDFLVSFNGGRAKVAKNIIITEYIDKLTIAVMTEVVWPSHIHSRNITN